MANQKEVYVVRDASGEYLAANGKRTPASDEAMEFETRDAALVACERSTDKILFRDGNDEMGSFLMNW